MKLRTRLSFHFLMQFFVFFVISFLLLLGLIFLIANFITKEELESHPQRTMVENIPISTMIWDEDNIQLSRIWAERLKEHDTWMQIINEKGEEVFASNLPDTIQSSYSINELLKIEETGKHGKYKIETHYEILEPKPYYFLLGYINAEDQLVGEWYERYYHEGMIDEERVSELENKLDKYDGKIEVYDDNNQIIQTIGLETDDDASVLSYLHTSGDQHTNVAIHFDHIHDTTWVFYSNLNDTKAHDSVFVSKTLQVIIISLSISLVIAITFSIWNGYRYGKPLLLFMNWFEAIKSGRYRDILSTHEQKKIFRKSGKMKFGYRLYKEVIESFANMVKKLKETDREREQLEDTREEWMTGISHDLRTPISSIQGYGHLLESNQYEFTPDELQGIGKVIREKSDYMVDLVEDFSLIFNMKNSTIEIDKSLIDLNHFIQTTVKKFQNDITLGNYTFICKPSDTNCYASIDAKWFVRALDNLIYNAVKHNPPSTVITVKLRNEDDQIMIDVIDNGVGMDEELVRHLFSRYYRGISTGDPPEGEGLGMSITKEIIDLHDGDIKVESEKDVGTIITILLKTND